MTDLAMQASATVPATGVRRDIGLKRRHAAETRFRLYGILAIAIGIGFLALLLVSIVSKGYTAFVQTSITIPVDFDAAVIDPGNKRATDPSVLVSANYPVVARNALLVALGVDPTDKAAAKEAGKLVSEGSRLQLRALVAGDPSVVGTTRNVTLLAAADIDSANKGQIDLSVPQAKRKVSDRQLAWLDQLRQAGQLSTPFNWGLLTFGAGALAGASNALLR